MTQRDTDQLAPSPLLDTTPLATLGEMKQDTENWRGAFHQVTVFPGVNLSLNEDHALFIETPSDTLVIGEITDIRRSKAGIRITSTNNERKMITTISKRGMIFEYHLPAHLQQGRVRSDAPVTLPSETESAAPHLIEPATEYGEAKVVELDGCIVGSKPTFSTKGGTPQWHATFYQHPDLEHPERSDTYEVHAWKLAPSLSKKKLHKGDTVWVKGYLREQAVLLGNGETKMVKHLNILGVRVISRASTDTSAKL